MEPFAQVEDVQHRLDFDMTTAEQRLCGNSLDDMSEEARFLAGQAWPIPEQAPRMVRTLVLKSVTRYMKNLEGLITSRAGDETLTLPDLGDKAGSPYFTEAEQNTLRVLGGKGEGGFVSVEATAYGTSWRRLKHHESTLVNTIGGGEPFPFNEECWD